VFTALPASLNDNAKNTLCHEFSKMTFTGRASAKQWVVRLKSPNFLMRLCRGTAAADVLELPSSACQLDFDLLHFSRLMAARSLSCDLKPLLEEISAPG
jgi:hypothetical protein